MLKEVPDIHQARTTAPTSQVHRVQSVSTAALPMNLKKNEMFSHDIVFDADAR